MMKLIVQPDGTLCLSYPKGRGSKVGGLWLPDGQYLTLDLDGNDSVTNLPEGWKCLDLAGSLPSGERPWMASDLGDGTATLAADVTATRLRGYRDQGLHGDAIAEAFLELLPALRAAGVDTAGTKAAELEAKRNAIRGG